MVKNYCVPIRAQKLIVCWKLGYCLTKDDSEGSKDMLTYPNILRQLD